MQTFSRFNRANPYHKVGLETSVNTASNHELIAMLYGGLLETLHRAAGAMERSDREEQGKALTKANRLLSEGLYAALDFERGGELSTNLAALYDYSMLELAKAHLKNDVGIVYNVIDLIRTLSDAWNEISPNHKNSNTPQSGQQQGPNISKVRSAAAMSLSL